MISTVATPGLTAAGPPGWLLQGGLALGQLFSKLFGSGGGKPEGPPKWPFPELSPENPFWWKPGMDVAPQSGLPQSVVNAWWEEFPTTGGDPITGLPKGAMRFVEQVGGLAPSGELSPDFINWIGLHAADPFWVALWTYALHSGATKAPSVEEFRQEVEQQEKPAEGEEKPTEGKEVEEGPVGYDEEGRPIYRTTVEGQRPGRGGAGLPPGAEIIPWVGPVAGAVLSTRGRRPTGAEEARKGPGEAPVRVDESGRPVFSIDVIGTPPPEISTPPAPVVSPPPPMATPPVIAPPLPIAMPVKPVGGGEGEGKEEEKGEEEKGKKKKPSLGDLSDLLGLLGGQGGGGLNLPGLGGGHAPTVGAGQVTSLFPLPAAVVNPPPPLMMFLGG